MLTKSITVLTLTYQKSETDIKMKGWLYVCLPDNGVSEGGNVAFLV